jgi:CheY-like chemotaxis protein
VLLERNTALRQLLGEALADLGFEVVPVAARKQALDHLLDAPDPDLLLVDVVDEAGGGEALLSFVAEQPELASIPIVVLTDGAEPEASQPHAVRLAKPFGVDALGTAVHEALARRPQRRQGTPDQHPAD